MSGLLVTVRTTQATCRPHVVRQRALRRYVRTRTRTRTRAAGPAGAASGRDLARLGGFLLGVASARSHPRNPGADRLRSAVRHLRHAAGELAADVLGLGLGCPARLLHCRVLPGRLGVLHDLVVGLSAGPRTGEETGREPSDEARSIQTHLTLFLSP